MATNVTLSITPAGTTSDVAIQVFNGGPAANNDINNGGFDGVYFSAYRSIGNYYNTIVKSTDGTPFDIATLSVADVGGGGDAIEVYAIDANGNESQMVFFNSQQLDITQAYTSQTVTLNYTGVYGIAINYLNNSGGAFYFDSDAFAAVTAPAAPDTTAPTLVNSTPADNANAVAAGANIVLNFDEDVVAGSGNITIVNDNDANDTRVISVSDAQISISNDVVTINPTADLLARGSYHVEIDAGAFEDAAGNAYAGITDPTALNFTVAARASGGGGGGTPTPQPVTVHTDDKGSAVASDKEEHFIGKQGNVDSVVFKGNHDSYSIIRNDDGSYTIKGAGAPDTLTNIDRLHFDDGILALDTDGDPGLAFRLYEAAFGRAPDADGLGFWIQNLDEKSDDLLSISKHFLESSEFKALYGSDDVTPEGFISLLYKHVLDRDVDDAGFAYWHDALDKGASYEWLLAAFSESVENKANTAGLMTDGIWYHA